MNTATVEAVIYEDGVEVDRISIRYYDGQVYWVTIATPDGAGARMERVLAAQPEGSA